MTPAPPDWLEGAVEEQAKAADPAAIRVGDLYKGVAYKRGDRRQWNVQLDGGGCIHLSAAGDQTVEEIALYLWGPDGKRLETERGDTPRTVLRHCPADGARGAYKFEAKVTGGHGHYAVGLYAQGNPNAAKKTPTDKPNAPSADLDGKMSKLAKSSAAGASIVGEPFKGNADSTDWYVALEKGNCYWFVGAGDEGVEKLNLFLWDPEDNRLKASKATSNEVTVGHCPDFNGMYHFRAQVNGGAGEYQVGVYAKKK